MKKLTLKNLRILLILSFIVIFLLILSLILNNHNINIQSPSLKIEYSKKINCQEKEELIKEDNYKIYTYCIDNLYINKNNKLIEFKEYYQEHKDIIDKLIKKDKNPLYYKDGGSIKYIVDNISIIKCHTLTGNEDIYIGDKNLKYEDNFCQENNSKVDQYLSYTYLILYLTPSSEEDYLYLTLRKENDDVVETVRVSKSIYNEYEVNKYYEFTFLVNNETILNRAIDIFNSATLAKVTRLD